MGHPVPRRRPRRGEWERRVPRAWRGQPEQAGEPGGPGTGSKVKQISLPKSSLVLTHPPREPGQTASLRVLVSFALKQGKEREFLRPTFVLRWK